MLRLIAFFLTLFTSISQACVVGPEKVELSESLGFTTTIEAIDLCARCKQITIKSPNHFRGAPISHGIVSIFLDAELISKSVSKVSSEDDSSRLISIVNLQDDISYRIEIEYGLGRCKSYQVRFSG